jgi:hypothetical protein
LQWEMVSASGCEGALTAVVYGDTSLDFSVAELGWWLNGTCAAGQCAANAMC